MDLSQTTPKAITPKLKQQIVGMARDCPTMPYGQIAKRFGVSRGTVSRVATAAGVLRRQPQQARARSIGPTRPEHLRDGGIIADDAQWRARQQRIG